MLDRSSKNTQISNVVKIRPVGAELVHVDGRTDGQTDTAKLKRRFSQFRPNAPTKCTAATAHENALSPTNTTKSLRWGGGRFESVRFWYTNSLMRRSVKIRNTNHDVMITALVRLR